MFLRKVRIRHDLFGSDNSANFKFAFTSQWQASDRTNFQYWDGVLVLIQLPITTFELKWELATFERLSANSPCELVKVTLQHRSEFGIIQMWTNSFPIARKTDNSGFPSAGFISSAEDRASWHKGPQETHLWCILFHSTRRYQTIWRYLRHLNQFVSNRSIGVLTYLRLHLKFYASRGNWPSLVLKSSISRRCLTMLKRPRR